MNAKELLDAQRALEDESRALGVARYRKHREASWQNLLDPNLDEASLPPARQLLRRYLAPTAEEIRKFLASASSGRAGRKHTAIQLLDGAKPEALAYLTLRSAINSGAQQRRLQGAAIDLANVVMHHLEAERFEEKNPGGAAGLRRKMEASAKVTARRQQLVREIHRKEGVGLNWSPREKLMVGTRLIELATQATGLFDTVLIEEGYGKGLRKQHKLILTDIVNDWLERQHERYELLDPIPLPMVIPPQPWTNPRDGGYLSPPPRNYLVRTHKPDHIEMVDQAEMPRVLHAVNTIQATAWKVNQPVLEMMQRVWNGGGSLGGLPHRDNAPLPAQPSDIDRSEAAKAEWKKRAEAVHRENAKRRGKRIAFLQKLSVAEKMAEYPAVYFPHSLDWRGRCYPIPKGGPEPQGNDIARSLLTFANGMPLGPTGGRWLAIHLANQFGIDKVSFKERISWVERHQDAILDSAANPLDGQRFWATADNPWQALAACFEWAGYVAEGDAFVSHLPIALDGSNSGLQHCTALLRDPLAAPHVNLVGSDQPGDLYSHIAALAQRVADSADDDRARAWRGGKISRQIAKQPCMTYAYGASRIGMAKQIEGALRDLDRDAASLGKPPHLGGEDNGAAAFWLAGLFQRLLTDAVPAMRSAMDWLRATTKLVSAAGLAVRWTTPLGLPVLNAYQRNPTKTVEINYCGRTMKLQLQDHESEDGRTAPINGTAAADGITPNFIHSLDAAHLMLVANACADQGIDSLAVIHDSFGTHAANTDALSTILRETFVDLYKSDPLGQLREAVLDQLRGHQDLAAQVPPLPDHGSFDIEAVREAAYMFA